MVSIELVVEELQAVQEMVGMPMFQQHIHLLVATVAEAVLQERVEGLQETAEQESTAVAAAEEDLIFLAPETTQAPAARAAMDGAS